MNAPTMLARRSAEKTSRSTTPHTTRKSWVRIHRWAAVFLGLHWLLLALTGLLLVFHRDVESALWVSDGPVQSESQAIERAVQIAREAAPDETITRVAMHDASLASMRVFVKAEGGSPDVLILDLASGAVAVRSPAEGSYARGSFFAFVYKLHQGLRLGRSGEILVGISALFLLVTVLAGIWLAWPKRSWRALLLPRLVGPGWSKQFLLHRAAGFVSAPLIIISIVTGAGTIWSKDLKAMMGVAAPAAAPAFSPPADDRPMIPPGRAVAAAKNLYPKSAFVLVDLPASRNAYYQVRLVQEEELRRVFGTTLVQVNPYSGEAIVSYDAVRASPVERGFDALFAIHNGEALGLAGRLITVFAGLALALTAFGGFASWAMRRKAKKR